MSLSDNLVAYWKLDEASGTRVDSTGRGNDLTDNNTVTSNTGILSNAAEFVAANSEYLSHATNDDLATILGRGLTISAWVYLHGSFSGAGQVVAKDDDAANSRDYTLDVDASKFRFYTDGGGGGIISHPATLSTETWYHVVAWYTGSSSGGVALNAGTATTSALANADPVSLSTAEFRIGAREYPAFEGYFFGRIDEVGIWHRVLTEDEITELYNGGAGLNYPFTAPAPSFRIPRLRPAIFKPGLAR